MKKLNLQITLNKTY